MFSFFILTALNYGCADKKKYEELEVNILLSGQKVEIFEGEKIYFRGKATGGRPPYTYSWTFGAVIPSSSLKEPGLIAFKLEGGYKVILTVKDSSGITREDYVHINVKKKPY
jgi:hypothetical protein